MGSFIQPSALYIIFTPNGSTHELRAVRYHLALGGEHDQLRVASGMDSEAPWAFNTWISVSTPLSQGMCELLQLADPHVENEARIRAFRSAIERDLEINLPNSQRSVRDIYRLMLTKAPAVQAGIRDHIELILRILFPNEEYWTAAGPIPVGQPRLSYSMAPTMTPSFEPFALYLVISDWTMPVGSTNPDDLAIQYDIVHYNPAVGVKVFRARHVDGYWRYRLDANPEPRGILDHAIVIMKIGHPSPLWPRDLAERVDHAQDLGPDAFSPGEVAQKVNDAFSFGGSNMFELILMLYVTNQFGTCMGEVQDAQRNGMRYGRQRVQPSWCFLPPAQ
ncbi:hypothetical protein CALVIDRAFT_565369 [Calocera viscosa TUFC12733]|uniref:Uncharacterized protein n=1 Tax=Calocera viscosa (strain TUFC12733) TaxID=1330018 RepID=A0A167KG94_CALVF|nr:hypothetical protein CALVIDRAFT_565369 [Calocera viscosa TUFC12733]